MPETRDTAALRRHYEVETELAGRLRAAAPAERLRLYRDVYNELFRRVPDHPQNRWKVDDREQNRRVEEQLRLLARHLARDRVYLEIGAGDCQLARVVAGRVRYAYGVDVSDVISATDARPPNFAFLLSNGTAIPAPDGCAGVAFSNMLVEHLHPDDFGSHLLEVARVLAPGGVYVCRTPHRFSGPQDISQFFDRVATGLHLREYTFAELTTRFRAAGFASVRIEVPLKRRLFRCPGRLFRLLEAALGHVPHSLRTRLCRSVVFRPLFRTITVVARTPTRREVGDCGVVAALRRASGYSGR
ncbi:class I SAM-dependent methyltransferase [bacterium]|nr:class I SAM-dependent methyltransferase [bacterium]